MKTNQKAPTESETAIAAILALNLKARSGDKQALEHLWQVGMLAADLLKGLSLDESTGKQVRKLAKEKTKWPFIVSAIPDIRNRETNLAATPANKPAIAEWMDGKKSETVVGNAANADAYAAWIGLGAGTGIKLKATAEDGTQRGTNREFHKPGSPCDLANRAWLAIMADKKRYRDQSEEEISSGRYHTWKVGDGEATGKTLQANRETLKAYVRAIRETNEKSDDNQWMKAARLWLDVTCEGNPHDADEKRWPEAVYKRGKKRSVRGVILERMEKGFEKFLVLSTAKKRTRKKRLG